MLTFFSPLNLHSLLFVLVLSRLSRPFLPPHTLPNLRLSLLSPLFLPTSLLLLLSVLPTPFLQPLPDLPPPFGIQLPIGHTFATTSKTPFPSSTDLLSSIPIHQETLIPNCSTCVHHFLQPPFNQQPTWKNTPKPKSSLIPSRIPTNTGVTSPRSCTGTSLTPRS